MFGWELPPYNSGGLGVACYGLSKALNESNVDVLFVLPKKINVDADFKVLYADGSYTVTAISSLLSPYLTEKQYKMLRRDHGVLYGEDLYEEVELFAQRARFIVENEEFDIIHAHDWLSFRAGLLAKDLTGKPLVVHVHSTEYDRTGGMHLNEHVYNIEKEGMEKADKIITVSNFTKNIVKEHYGIDDSKIEVLHNRINSEDYENSGHDVDDEIFSIKKQGRKIVLFVGRITLQKGPDYFLKVAKSVLAYDPNILFVMAGSGDMQYQIMEDAAVMGISDKVLFTGFLRGKELSRVFKLADLFVMPSVSEPFSITTLESIIHDTPVLISKQSGVSEVLSHALKVDFWDIDEMTNKILSVVHYDTLKECLSQNGKEEVKHFTWDAAAKECINIYNKILNE